MAAKAVKIHKPYPKPCCPNCGRVFKSGQLQTGEMLCPSCRNMFSAVLFTPPPEVITVRRMTSSAIATADAAVAGTDSSTLEREAPCAKHPGNCAEGICERCGAFACALCRIELGGKGYCPDCFERLLENGNDEFQAQHATHFRGVARMCAVVGLFPYIGLLLGPVAVYFSIRAIKQRRSGEVTAGGMGGLILILVLGVIETAGNAALIYWIATMIFKNLGRGMY